MTFGLCLRGALVAALALAGTGIFAPAQKKSRIELVIQRDPLSGCCEEACSVAFSPDGKILASKLYPSGFGGHDGIILWDVSKGRLIRGLPGPPEGVYSIFFSPDGRNIASQKGIMWDIESGRAYDARPDDVVNPGNPSDYRTCYVGFSPDGSVVSSGTGRSGSAVTFRDASSRRVLRTFTTQDKTGLVLKFDKSGSLLLSKGGFGDFIHLFDANTGRLLSRIMPECETYDEVAYSSDGKLVAVRGCEDGNRSTINIFDAATGTIVRNLDGHSSLIFALDFSPDAKVLASASSDRTVKLWDVTNGSLLHTLEGHSMLVRSVAFSPDGKMIASGGGDNETKLWSADGQLLITFRVFNDGNWIAYTPDAYYNRSEGAAKYIRWRVGNETRGEGSFRGRFNRPDAVAARLRSSTH